jgi:hypothetical protein
MIGFSTALDRDRRRARRPLPVMVFPVITGKTCPYRVI